MDYYIKTLIAAAFGTLGFGLLFKVKTKTLPICFIGGLSTWGVALACEALGGGVFTMNLFASVYAMLFSMFTAIKLKLPSTILLITCIVPLVPGGSLFYTMQSIILNDWADAYLQGGNTLLTAVGIAGGILTGSIIFSAVRKPIPNKFRMIGNHFTNGTSFQIHYMHLNKDPFEKILSGNKTVELRLYDTKRKNIKLNDVIEFSCEGIDKTIKVNVVGLNVYPTFKELYENVPLSDIGYSEDELLNASYKDMEKYYSIEDQLKYSVVAIKIAKLQ